MPRHASRAIFGLLAALTLALAARAQTPPGSPQTTPPATPISVTPDRKIPGEPLKRSEVVERLIAEAGKLRPLVASQLAQFFLGATSALPDVQARTIYRTADKSKAITAEQWANLPATEQALYKPRECTPEFYYYTGYGSPLVYARVLDVAAAAAPPRSPQLASFEKLTILDFGYGTIGHLKLMSACGAHAKGVDVDPLLGALYSQPGDTGEHRVPAPLVGTARPPGSTTIFAGRWPADAALTTSVGTGYDIITSKNTLKCGYIHPAREVDEKFLVKLGVSDEAFLAAVHTSLKRDGLFIIYNISPKQNPADKPYLPHADGKSPFTKDQFTKAGFEVLAFDTDDTEKVLDYWTALGYDEGKGRDELKGELFAWYTVVRKR